MAGQTPKSLQAFANLKRICEEHLAGEYHIEVIDLLKSPQLAKGDQILALPTLVRKLPEPVRKIIGDLSNTERVLVGLDLRPRSARRQSEAQKSNRPTPRRSRERLPRSRRRNITVCGFSSPGPPPGPLAPSRTSGPFARRSCKGRYDLEVIDIYQHPEQAKPEQIVVAPTLVKKLPLPVRRLIGDLSDQERVLAGLDIVPCKPM